MNMRAALTSRLGQDPVSRQTKSGAPMCTASVVVPVGKASEDISEWFNLAAFGSTGEALAEHNKGETVTVPGHLTRSAYTGRDGVERQSWNVRVDTLISARTERVGLSKRKVSSPRQARPVRNGSSSGPSLPSDAVDDLFVEEIVP